MGTIVPLSAIRRQIYEIRGQRVMLAHDLAELYGVQTFNLNKAVRRNIKRFPEDFMFQINKEEAQALKFQIGISKTTGRGGRRRALPYAFTEQGVAMLSSVLRSQKAAQVNVEIIRTFVRLRELAASHKDLGRKLNTLERKYDRRFRVVFEAIRGLMEPPDKPRPRIGF